MFAEERKPGSHDLQGLHLLLDGTINRLLVADG